MSSPSPLQDQTAAPTELATFGPVHLDVTDLDRSLSFWHDLIGLQVRDRQSDEVSLGTDE